MITAVQMTFIPTCAFYIYGYYIKTRLPAAFIRIFKTEELISEYLETD